MICSTVREGMNCPFMTAKGCNYNDGICHEIDEKCKGCNRSTEFSSGWYCTVFPAPSLKWKNGNCNFASHIAVASNGKKAKLNPIKASKRMGG